MTRPHTVLAFDFGLKRIGIACGDTVTRQAAPRPATTVLRGSPDWDAIAKEVRALAPALLVVGAPYLVVGAPYNAGGNEGTLLAAARRFAAELERRFALPVQLVDERFSSLEASETLKKRRASGERRRRLRREDIDSAAAAVILGRWFQGEGEGTMNR
ncbi:MAG TPA: Holliday junction resolvase RuvX [Steroidobacteraceae bacterium]|jgi:putative Holliday junction resolvase